MKIKHILLLSTLALPLVTPNVIFSSESATAKDKAKDLNLKTIQEMALYYSDYARILDKAGSLDKDFYDYFSIDTSASSSSTIEPYKNKTADINAWKSIILNHQYIIRDAAHRSFIKNLAKKTTELSKAEVQLLFYTQYYIKNCISYTARILSSFSGAESSYNKFKNALAKAAFPEIFGDEAKLKELKPEKSLKLESPIIIMDTLGKPSEYDAYVEPVKSEDVKDFSLPQELKDHLQTLTEVEKLRLQNNGGLIVQISQLVRLGSKPIETSKIINEGYILFSVVLDNKLDIKDAHIIRLIKPNEKNTTTQKDSEIFSSNELSRKIQYLTIESRASSPSSDKENMAQRNQIIAQGQTDAAGTYAPALRDGYARERDYRASDFASYSDNNNRAALADSYNASARKGYTKPYRSSRQMDNPSLVASSEATSSSNQDSYRLPSIKTTR